MTTAKSTRANTALDRFLANPSETLGAFATPVSELCSLYEQDPKKCVVKLDDCWELDLNFGFVLKEGDIAKCKNSVMVCAVGGCTDEEDSSIEAAYVDVFGHAAREYPAVVVTPNRFKMILFFAERVWLVELKVKRERKSIETYYRVTDMTKVTCDKDLLKEEFIRKIWSPRIRFAFIDELDGDRDLCNKIGEKFMFKILKSPELAKYLRKELEYTDISCMPSDTSDDEEDNEDDEGGKDVEELVDAKRARVQAEAEVVHATQDI